MVKKDYHAILGLDSSERLGLLYPEVGTVAARSVDVFEEFPQLFQETGRKIVLQKDAVPTVQPARRVSVDVAATTSVRADAYGARAHHSGVLSQKVSEPTDWVSPFVIVRKKDGILRVFMDQGRINATLKREHYQMPRREDIEAEVTGAMFFSCLGANTGFHQVPLDQPSSKACTFARPFGR